MPMTPVGMVDNWLIPEWFNYRLIILLFDVIEHAIFCLQFFFLASVWLARWVWRVWKPCNAYCDYEELTDFEINSLANDFCDYEELKDFCSNKILWGIGWNCEDFEQGQPAKLAESIPVQKSSAERWQNQLNCSKLMLMNSLFTYKHAIAAMLSELINSSVMPTFIGSQRSFRLLHQNFWMLAMGMLSN